MLSLLGWTQRPVKALPYALAEILTPTTTTATATHRRKVEVGMVPLCQVPRYLLSSAGIPIPSAVILVPPPLVQRDALTARLR